MTKTTLIGVGCDPECEFKSVFSDLRERYQKAYDSVNSAPYEGNEDDIRPTSFGYSQIDVLNAIYAGLMVLETIGDNCEQACAIADFVNRNNTEFFGSEVRIEINRIEGK